ncbi:MAG TPA: FAD-binding oxidoreductase [Thermomicrobiales bacterium]|nr:FAD-binding oxidoreductase [Thermomicrobiales bacterium]
MVTTDRSSLATRTILDFPDAMAVFRSRLSGSLITQDDASYASARPSRNLRMHSRPFAILQAANENDVIEAVRFTTAQQLHLAIRSGGHGIAGYDRVECALLVDLANLQQVTVDPITRTARVQPGATSAVIAAAAHEHGLALSTGDTSSVGIGGLTTGGGIGFLSRAYGLTIDSLISARVVTAAGEVLVASAIEHPDLFWAIRGGGSNFGIVTEFTFRLAPVDTVLGGILIQPATRETLRGYLERSIAAPDGLTTMAHIMHAPPLPFVPQEWIGKMVLATLVCWTGTPESGQAALAPFRSLAEPVVDMVSEMPYPAMFQFTDHQAHPHSGSIRMMFADDLSDTTLDAMLTAVQTAPTPFPLIQLRAMGGAIARIDCNATAFSNRHQRYFVAVIGPWMDPADTGAVAIDWTMRTWEAIREDGDGVYVNFLRMVRRTAS